MRAHSGHFFSCAVLVLMAAVLGSSLAAGQEKLDLQFTDLNGQPQAIAATPGQVTVVNFWATWCVACKAEMPLFVDLQKHYKEGVRVVTVSLDDKITQQHIDFFVQKYKMNFPVLLGTVDDLKKAGLGEALPGTLVLDGNGKVVARVLGEVSKSDLHRRVEWALTGKGDAPVAVLNNLNKKPADDTVHVY
jgi:thiol-disulfide isomerase/thioredoxin